MALRLRIVSEHAGRLGSQATRVFGVHGGSIGRGTDTDWTLPDPERYLSGTHARLEFRAGQFFIVDCSSNGTYLNGAQAALGKSNDRQLKDGDYLRMGEYEMLVSIDDANDFPPEDGAIVAYDGGTPSPAVSQSIADDIGARLDLSELLEPQADLLPGASSDVPGRGPVPAHDAYGQSLPPVEEGSDWHMKTRPLRIQRTPAAEARLAEPLAAPPGRTRSLPLFDADVDSGISELWRGAGLEPDTLTPDNRAAMLQLCGRLLREVVVGLLDVRQATSDFRNRFRISAPADRETPDFLTRDVDGSLRKLLTTASVRGGSLDAIRDAFQQLRAHQCAVLPAMHAAFEESLAQLDPKDLAERFERNSRRSVFGQQGKGRYWDLYAELYNSLTQRQEGGFPHLFVETFARVFEERIAGAPTSRRAFGTDQNDATLPSASPRAASGD